MNETPRPYIAPNGERYATMREYLQFMKSAQESPVDIPKTEKKSLFGRMFGKKPQEQPKQEGEFKMAANDDRKITQVENAIDEIKKDLELTRNEYGAKMETLVAKSEETANAINQVSTLLMKFSEKAGIDMEDVPPEETSNVSSEPAEFTFVTFIVGTKDLPNLLTEAGKVPHCTMSNIGKVKDAIK